MYNLDELKKKVSEDYWKQKYQKYLNVDILHALKRTGDRTGAETVMATSCVEIPVRLSLQIEKLCSESEDLIYAFYLSALNVLLSRYSGYSGFYIGTTPFINIINEASHTGSVLLCEANVIGTASFKDIYSATKEEIAQIYKNYDPSTFALAQLERMPEVGFFMEKISQEIPLESGLMFIIKMEHSENGWVFKVIFNAERLDILLVEKFSRNFVTTLSNILNNIYSPVNELEVVSQEESGLLSSYLNTALLATTDFGTMHGVFEQQVYNTPHAIALVTKNGVFTYSQLNEQANRLAHYLRNKYDLAIGEIVALLFEPDETMILAILGVLKAGGAYLPLDPKSPVERTEFIFADASVRVLLTDTNFFFFLPAFTGEIVALDIELPAFENRTENPENLCSCHDLAYIIYTSGSTGVPKGVMVEHGSSANMINSQIRTFDIKENDRALQFASPSFDASVSEIFLALHAGASLVLMERSLINDPDVFVRFLKEKQVSVVTLPPAYLRTIDRDKLNFLKVLITAGEKANTSDAIFYSKVCNYYNAYGPTECAVCATIYKVSTADEHETDISIGKAIDHNSIILLDEKNNLVPMGAVGEICVTGIGLARGYLNRPALTSEKFIRWSSGEHRIYKTGDLGRFRADGMLDYAGRRDEQVKVRGYRIELGEIEQRLCDLDGVLIAVVLPLRNSGDTVLVAYLESNGDVINTGWVRTALASWLPAYMIPGIIVQVDKIPVTINGKIDKELLATYDLSALGTVYKAPVNELERRILRIWQTTIEKDKIGVSDNFFEIGGHSLKAIQIISLIHKELGIRVELKDIFDHPTIEQLAGLLAIQRPEVYLPIPKAPEADYFPVSHSQQRLWVLDQFEEKQIAYNISGVYIFEGVLDLLSLQKAFNSLIQRHEILRTIFSVAADGSIQQQVLLMAEQKFSLSYINLIDADSQDVQVKDLIDKNERINFSLSEGPLMSCLLVQTMPSRYSLLFSMHHIISDGWSMEILTRELLVFYSYYCNDRIPELPDLSVQYKDYAGWQNELLESGKMSAHRSYWLKQFEGEIPVLDLQSDFNRPNVKTHHGKQLKIALDAVTVASLKSFSREHDATVFMLLLSAVESLLYRYTGQQDIILGTTVAGREHHDLEDQIGFYVNTLALRCKPGDNDAFTDLLSANRQMLLEAYEHQYYPFDKLVEELPLDRNMSRSPLFDVLVELVNIPSLTEVAKELKDLNIEALEPETCNSKFDLTFRFIEQDNRLELVLEYNPDLYKHSRIERMGAHLLCLLEFVTAHPDCKVNEIDYLQPSERLLLESGGAVSSPSRGMWLPLFENVVLQQPEATALRYEGQTFSYAYLNAAANRLAHHLRDHHGIKAGMVIGLQCNRSVEQIIGVLGILKSGGILLPVDGDYPSFRKQHILSNAGAQLLLTESSYVFDIDYYEGPLFALDLELEGLKSSIANPAYVCGSADTAYIIYTSGSTGLPKGVEISWSSFSNYLLWANRYYFDNSNGYPFALFTSLSFDLTITSLFTPLLRGDEICLSGSGITGDLLHSIFAKGGMVRAVKMTPSHVHLLSHLELDESDVSVVILGGEAVTENHVAILRSLNAGMRIYNEYGPTEATVGCVVCELHDDDDAGISIGVPVDNVSVYVLDSHMNLLPAGYMGELWIGGNCLAKGYRSNALLTEERFKFVDIGGVQRLYRTGDLCSRDETGLLWYHGRVDNQVKVRGYRIEPEETEQHLCLIPGVKNAVVLAREEKDTTVLVGYLEGNRAEININSVRVILGSRLPAYMIPGELFVLDQIPVTINGKVDRKFLLEYTDVDHVETSTYKAPSNKLETDLLGIWTKVLGKELIGVSDNFFETGGHSLKAIQIVSHVQKELGIKIELKDIFNYPDVERLAALIAERQLETYIPITPVEKADSYPLSHAQKRLWILEQLEPGNAAYNISGAYNIQGSLEIVNLEKAFDALIARHEILRTVFTTSTDGIPQQQVSDAANHLFRINYADLREDEDKLQKVKELTNVTINKGFSLSDGPLLRAAILHLEESCYSFVFTIHHIISDGWSIDILTNELFELYNGYCCGILPRLPILHIQYKDYASWQNRLLDSGKMELHQTYWLEQFQGDLPVLDLPEDHKRPAIKTHAGAYVSTVLDQALTERIEYSAKKYSVSSFMLMVSVLKTLFYKYTGQTDIIIGVPVAGRQHPDLENQIGMYVNTIAIRTSFSGKDNFNELLIKIKNIMLSGYQHQSYPFDSLVEEIGVSRDLSRSPVFDIMVNSPDVNLQESISVPGLTLKEEEIHFSNSKFDLTFYFREAEGLMTVGVQYNTALYSVERINMMLTHYKRLATIVTGNPLICLNEINYLEDIELRTLLDVPPVRRRFTTVIKMFEEQVIRTPDATAVICNGGTITYEQLNRRANQLSNYLIKQGLEKGTCVLLLLKPSFDAIVSVIATLKIGAVMVPIDLSYPDQRKKHIVRETAGHFVITNLGINTGLEQEEIIIIDLVSEGEEIGKEDHANLSVVTSGDDAAYVMFTSGSTGNPKGILCNHESFSSSIKILEEEYQLGKYADFILGTSISADPAMRQIFIPLTTGARLHLIEDSRDIRSLAVYLVANRIDALFSIPSTLRILIEEINDIGGTEHLRFLSSGSEVLDLSLAQRIKIIFPEVILSNMYAPTEICMGALHYTVQGNEQEELPVGVPFAHLNVYILDASLNLMPAGYKGEICISGRGVKSGYLNQPEYTAVKFVSNPFSRNDTDEMLYRTGDVGMRLPDGTFKFAGRLDNQVKIRGFRIELEEIEHALYTFAGIQHVVVDKRMLGAEWHLVAFYHSDTALVSGNLRAFLAELLPDYMIPSYFVFLPEFPLLTNGKIDRKAIINTAVQSETLHQKYIPAQTLTEQKLAFIWCDLLSKDSISVNDSFFELGGHSLKGVQMISRIQKELNVKISLRDVFTHTTITSLAGMIRRLEMTAYSLIMPVPEQPHYEVSHAQRRLWVLDQLQQGQQAYNICGAYLFEGKLNKEALVKAFDKLLMRHEILRTVFLEADGQIRQKILNENEHGFVIGYTDLRPYLLVEQKKEEIYRQEAAYVFDLSNGPLIRAHLIQESDEKFLFILTLHHIISDGWSMELLRKEVLTLYNAYCQTFSEPLEPLRIQYKDYAHWQNSLLSSAVMQEHKVYWNTQFEDTIPVLQLPVTKQRPAIKTYKSGRFNFSIENEQTLLMDELRFKYGVSLHSVVISVFNTLLFRYSGAVDIVIGTPASGRIELDLETQIGCYINLLPLRTRFSEDTTFDELLLNVHQQLLSAQEHEIYPFDKLVEDLQLQPDMSRSALFDVLINNFESVLAVEQMYGDVSAKVAARPFDAGKYDITLNYAQESSGISFDILYNKDLFELSVISSMAVHMKGIIAAVLENSRVALKAIKYIQQDEEDILTTFNQTAVEFKGEDTIQRMFEAQVRQTPNATALVYGEVRLSYAELNKRANELASYLCRYHKVSVGDIVGVMLEPSEQIFISLLGILKCGAAFLPISPDLPKERVLFMLKDTSAKVLIAEGTGEDYECPLINISLFKQPGILLEDNNPVQKSVGSSLAYVLYTSGTTGTPKGVAIPVYAVINYANWLIKQFNIGLGDSSMLLSTYTFDGVYTSVWGCLLSGACLHVLSAFEVKDPPGIMKYIARNNISFIKITASLLHLLLEAEYSAGQCDHLRLFVIGGEPINISDVKRLRQMIKGIRVVNHYGPTETTVGTIFNEITDENISAPNIGQIIGRPISNMQVYVLDGSQQLVPIGVPGELYIGGVGVGIGYLNAIDLTSEKFLQHPLPASESRLYRTGDMGRWLSDGRIEFLGRKDTQVKIRGYRIELEEIRYQIKKHELVEDAVVVVSKQLTGEQDIVCYLKHSPVLTHAVLQSFLKETLPVYMLPSRYISIDDIPVTANGKVNMKLLVLNDKQLAGDNLYVLPKSVMEENLLAIWQEVLQREHISTTDNFFETGGHSLKAIQVVTRIHKQLGLKISLKDLFINNTITRLSALLAGKEYNRYDQIPAVKEEPYYMLSHAQKRLWILDQMEHGQIAYNMLAAYVFQGRLNIKGLEWAFEQLIARHEILRTVFIVVDGEPRQAVLSMEDQHFQLVYIDLRGDGAMEQKVHDTAARLSQTPFSLIKGPLLRSSVIRTGDEEYIFLFSMHHIISDGWSMVILADELQKLYTAYDNNMPVSLPVLPVHYKDYVSWQNEQLRAGELQLHRSYWQKQLNSPLPVLELPPYKSRPLLQTYNGAQLKYTFSSAFTVSIYQLSLKYEVTPFMLLISVSDLLFYRYSGQHDIILGTSVAGRNRRELEGQIGIYLNSIALRCQLDPNWRFQDLLLHMKGVIMDGFEHQSYPFDMLVEELNIARDISRSAVFDVLVEMQNFDEVLSGEKMIADSPSFLMRPYELKNNSSKFDLNLMFSERNGQLGLSVNYNTDLFDAGDIGKMVRHFEQLINEIVPDQNKALCHYNLLLPEEEELLGVFNSTERSPDQFKTVVEVFNQQVLLYPDAIAISYGIQNISYQELGTYSDNIARQLLSRGLRKGDLVAVLSSRNTELVGLITGIFKAGAVYLPLGSSYPAQRLSEILQLSAAQYLLIEDNILDSSMLSLITNNAVVQQIIIPTIDDSREAGSEGFPVFPSVDSSDLCYVIYTSGSTGTPKGVMIEHGGMLNHLYAKTEELGITHESVIVQNAAATFDISIWQMFAGLTAGGRTVIYDDSLVLSPGLFAEALLSDGVSILEVVPSYLSALLDVLDAVPDLRYPVLKQVLVTGETLPGSLVRRWFKRFESIPLVNAYGPTEASDDITHYHMTGPVTGEQVPVGHVLRNLKIYIVDEQFNLCPVGVKGEICVSGVGVGRGYLGDAQRSAAVFMEDPFRSERGVRLYRTGDMGRYRADGVLEYYGRRDSQVKVRGYRIELGEIEHRLSETAGVRNGVVLVKPGADASNLLVCWLLLEEGTDVAEVRESLGHWLPAYMIPDLMLVVDELPLTVHGKVDRQALLNMSLEGLEAGSGYVGPVTETEKLLQQIWEEVLGLERISMTDNFFMTGGHSLKAVQIVSRIHKEFQVQVELRNIFTHPTIKGLAKVIQESGKSGYEKITEVAYQKYYEVSHAQRRLWILDKFEEEQIAYNLPVAVILEGALDLVAFEDAFLKLIKRHEILRTRFSTVNGIPVQQIQDAETAVFYLEFIDVKHTSEEELQSIVKESANRPFNLEEGPLLRATLLQQEKDKFVFLLTMHHIISDGWSMEILVKEVLTLYNAHLKGIDIQLVGLSIQYKDYAAWQNSLLDNYNVRKHKEYWLAHFNGEIPVLNIPADYSRPPLLTSNGNIVTCSISSELSVALKKTGDQYGASLFMVLLSSVKALLYRYTGQEDIIIGSPSAGRDHYQLEDQIGFYVNTLALRTQFKGTEGFSSLLQKVKEVTLGAHEHQLYPFDRLVDDLNLQRDMSRSPLFDVMVALENSALTLSAQQGFGDIVIKEYPFAMTISKFDLSFDFYENEDGIKLRIVYNSDIYKEGRIQRMAKQYVQLLLALTANIDLALNKIPYLSETEEQQLLFSFNNTTAANESGTATILDLFANCVAHRKNFPAVISGKDVLTYESLDKASSRMAHYLLSNHLLQADDLVAIMVTRSEKMLIYILAILKAGAAYIPIDPDYPQERVTYMIAKSSIKILISDQATNDYTGDTDCIIINPETHADRINLCPDTIPHVNIKPDNLAYVIYTSGSSGLPKGVMVEHRNLLNIALGWIESYELDSFEVRLLQIASISFDVFCGDMCRSLLTGGCMVIVPAESRTEPADLSDLIIKHKINIFESTPGLIIPLMEYIYEEGRDVSFIRLLILGSDTCRTSDFRKIQQRFGKTTRIINSYGTTETTIDSCYYESALENIPDNESVAIGRPMRNTCCYILDNNKELLPVGIPGELYIAGTGVSRGYLNNEDLTRERFLNNPFLPGTIFYRTGDTALWNEDGIISILGRNDLQVKLRGYRIELGEIEHRLTALEGVIAGVVLLKEENDGEGKYLVAWIVLEEGIDVEMVKMSLSNTLPVYMVPDMLLKVDKLPLTENGKIDRAALQKMIPEQTVGIGQWEKPGTVIESVLAEVWEDVLGKKNIGIHDSFFQLGGESIKAIQIASRMYKRGYKLEVRNILGSETISEVKRFVKEISKTRNDAPVTGPVPLTPSQWEFFSNGSASFNHYNQAILLLVAKGYSIGTLNRFFNKLLEHHDALRMTFDTTNANVSQYNAAVTDSFEIAFYDFQHIVNPSEKLSEIAEAMQLDFNINRGPLLSAAYIELAGEARLLIVIHHLVIDGVSWRILFEDLDTLMEQHSANMPLILPGKTDSFKQWATQLLDLTNDTGLPHALSFWKSMKGRPSGFIPRDFAEDVSYYKNEQTIHFEMDEDTTSAMLRSVNFAFNTFIDDLLLVSVALGVQEMFRINSLLILLEKHGREDIVKGIDVSRTVGWFTSEFPVLLHVNPQWDLSRQIQEVKETLRKVPDGGIGYGMLKYGSHRHRRDDFDFSPQICFNYLGELDAGALSKHLKPTAGDTGSTISPHWQRSCDFEIVAAVLEKKLRVAVKYSTTQYYPETVQALANAYKEQLHKLIKYCLEQEKQQLTPSDISDVDISIDDFNTIFEA